MATPASAALSVAGSEPRSYGSFALRHQIAVLKRSQTRRPCFRLIDRLFWILLSRWWPQWRESLVIVQAETVLRWRRNAGLCSGDIGDVVAGEVDVLEFPVSSAT